MIVLILVFLLLTLVVAVFLAYFNDPYFRWSRIQNPFVTSVENGKIVLRTRFTPKLVSTQISRVYALLITGLRIPLYSLLTIEKPLTGSETDIINQIHQIRFNPDKPYVITGSHYPDLYMRNMGIFFNALLDPRLPTTEQDWQNRQRIALQTIAYDLAFLDQNTQAVTTIVPVGFKHFTGLNIYRQPSDALFAVLYALRALTDENFVMQTFPVTRPGKSGKQQRNRPQHQLQTQQAAQQLLVTYHDALSRAINHYLWMALDDTTGMISRRLHLSSARDGVKRDCSFYDNVIAWATVRLADELNVTHMSRADLKQWKQNIIDAYWDDELGIFRDDLSGCGFLDAPHSYPPASFSADSFIVTSTGFFDVKLAPDQQKLCRMVQYVQDHQLDRPFPLSYTKSNNRKQMHGPVKYFAPSYMGEGIWSHWGMEYIKTLLLLSATEPKLKQQARQHLQNYGKNIVTCGGYPELYNRRGKLYKSVLVRGVLHTGWVVNYEQARMLL